VAQLVDALR